ncbi:MAG TPA: septum formation protein Maf [Candidatus Marinimicrobia bacterium]|jgi:septum formation protein|nr:Maf family protein [Candidatus Neomarinimicrobiota bacterium]HBR87149.1 septum formation protein Maf [Candidatus Neomarinimicrobiota bacterium]HJL62712.1 Maf family protein [Candidatus Neomarinimicrobiota bacterium]
MIKFNLRNNLPPFSIILASASPRRKQLLNMIDIDFEVIPSDVHEDFNIDLNHEDFVQHYAREKSLDIAEKYPDHLVIGADTIVVLDSKILGKPKDEADSFNMLKSLSGRTHTVYTGVSLNHINEKISDTFFEQTQVSFNELSDSVISYYIDTYKPLDKAGSYGIQDWFALNVNRIDGCFYNVMGFPLAAFFSHYKKYDNSIVKVS